MRSRCWIVIFAALAILFFPARSARAQDEELSCNLQRRPPVLDFEFRFFSGFVVDIPVKQLIGPPRLVRLKLTVTPLSVEGAEPAELSNETMTDEIPDSAKGRIEISNSFVVGEGRYRIDWELQDGLGKSCRLSWEIEAKLKRSDGDVRMTMRPGEVGDSRVYLFRPESVRADESLGRPLRVKVFLNYDPWRRRRAASPRLFEFAPRVAALRAISRHPRIGEVAMVVYSLDEQKVLHRHGLQDHFNYGPLRSALEQLSPAMVSIEQLGKYKQRDFFTDMLLAELPGDEEVDAYVFLGPDAEFGRKAPPERVAEIGRLPAPVFALVSNRAPWKGLVGNAVKEFGGEQERFLGPRDLAEALEKIVERLDRIERAQQQP